MRIMMMTNTYLPHVGGVARSVTAFTTAYRALGHEVMVVAPEFEGMDTDEDGVVRVSAIQKFNGSDFSLMLPDSGVLDEAVVRFRPEIIHSHHPFLVGSAALRLASTHDVPLVFTHHTMYEEYTHYAPGDSQLLKRFVATLSTHYANLCQRVFAPSESIASILAERGVTVPMHVVPTGVREELFVVGSGSGFRAAMGIPRGAFVVGHVGRLALEKNLPFLTRATAAFLHDHPNALFLVVGAGPCAADMRAVMREHGVEDRFILAGVLEHSLLVSAYRAMDVFAFASKSETQGMVLTEAMAARTPVVAIDAPGVREVVEDGRNGRLLAVENEADFTAALAWLAGQDPANRKRLRRHALMTAKRYSLARCARTAISVYEELRGHAKHWEAQEYNLWDETVKGISGEWTVIKSIVEAAGKAIVNGDATDPAPP